ncbi:hypothetical protein [Methylovulum psychrotolerans]|uniref:Uncharacterized protein n=1 Tax=Methylovulum psychrotolerans TaxID=1704499 RepID=A0A1Z4C0H8_9GAMM|nr:hypothetical protein [Methylovulum psychrotolerans]ASF47020.1 hypothetical protein CEK71_13585 [Methylovulum psychrotolerans]
MSEFVMGESGRTGFMPWSDAQKKEIYPALFKGNGGGAVMAQCHPDGLHILKLSEVELGRYMDAVSKALGKPVKSIQLTGHEAFVQIEKDLFDKCSASATDEPADFLGR